MAQWPHTLASRLIPLEMDSVGPGLRLKEFRVLPIADVDDTNMWEALPCVEVQTHAAHSLVSFST